MPQRETCGQHVVHFWDASHAKPSRGHKNRKITGSFSTT